MRGWIGVHLATWWLIGCGPGCAALPAEQLGPPTTQGHVVGALVVHDFASHTFANTRALRVLLPPGYDDERNRTRRYPVLLLNDGQNLFDAATAVLNAKEWRADETVAALVASGEIPPIIIVGIDNAGRRQRFREYFPYVDEYLQPPEPDPQGRRYPAFVVDEVLPFVHARYRTRRDAAGIGIGGSSAGALAALYAAIARPAAFGQLLLESPSLYVDEARVLRDAARATTWPGRIYVGAGTNEEGAAECRDAAGDESELVQDVRRFERLLREAGVARDRLRVVVEPCGRHDEDAWARRLPAALRFLYGADER